MQFSIFVAVFFFSTHFLVLFHWFIDFWIVFFLKTLVDQNFGKSKFRQNFNFYPGFWFLLFQSFIFHIVISLIYWFLNSFFSWNTSWSKFWEIKVSTEFYFNFYPGFWLLLFQSFIFHIVISLIYWSLNSFFSWNTSWSKFWEIKVLAKFC